MNREEKRARTRESLLAAGRELVAKRGVEAVTLDEIASAAGLTIGAVYSNFASKADLMVAVLDLAAGDSATDIPISEDLTRVETLEGIGRWVARLSESPEYPAKDDALRRGTGERAQGVGPAARRWTSRSTLAVPVAVGLVGLALVCVGVFRAEHRGASQTDAVRPVAVQRILASQVDPAWAAAMIVHHENAITMAKDALARSDSPAIEAVAQDILLSQTQEVIALQQELGAVPAKVRAEAEHQGSSAMSAMMSVTPLGMASPLQLEELQGASSSTINGLFVTLMTRQNEGGLSMDLSEAKRYDRPATQLFALRSAQGERENLVLLHGLASAISSGRGSAPFAGLTLL